MTIGIEREDLTQFLEPEEDSKFKAYANMFAVFNRGLFELGQFTWRLRINMFSLCSDSNTLISLYYL